MRTLVFAFCVLTVSIFGIPIRYEIQVGDSNLVYYLDAIETNETYPLAIIMEGSYVDQLGPQSVLRLHGKIAIDFLNSGINVIMMERRGVDGNIVDHDVFHKFNFPTQRLSDHLALVAHLRSHPPPSWNGKLILIGGSEGGPIAIQLAHKVEPSICVAIVGCGSTSFQEYIWKSIRSMQASASFLKKALMNWWYDIPEYRAEYDAKCAMMKGDPNPQKKWFGQTFLYWADALDQNESKEFLELKCPIIVVAGSEDIECESTDKLIEVAKRNSQEVMYLRIEGMAHDALDPKWGVINAVIELIQKTLYTQRLQNDWLSFYFGFQIEGTVVAAIKSLKV